MNLRDQLPISNQMGADVSESELERVLLTVAAAILNPSAFSRLRIHEIHAIKHFESHCAF
jgi:hypothetical protein